MINIKLYQYICPFRHCDKKALFRYVDAYRQEDPVIFNIETTNLCNQKCTLCPRTSKMTRKQGTMEINTFNNIIDQIKPWRKQELDEWENFVAKNYSIKKTEQSENHFFFYIVSKVITLHGYGEPLLDKHIFDRVQYLTDRKIPSYFSSHPLNVSIKSATKLINAGLAYMKFSSDNVNHFIKMKDVFNELISVNDNTTIIFNIVGTDDNIEKLKELFGNDVYIYQKSVDNVWYNKSKQEQKAFHWKDYCLFPWNSLSVMWDGSIVPCSQDYNCEMVLGNADDKSLLDIWNSVKYYNFRINQSKYKCKNRCDMKLLNC